MSLNPILLNNLTKSKLFSICKLRTRYYEKIHETEKEKEIKNQLVTELKELEGTKIKGNTIKESVIALLLSDPVTSLKTINHSRNTIGPPYMTSYHASLHLLSAYIWDALRKEALKKGSPQPSYAVTAENHLRRVKTWAQKILDATSKNGKPSQLSTFS